MKTIISEDEAMKLNAEVLTLGMHFKNIGNCTTTEDVTYASICQCIPPKNELSLAHCFEDSQVTVPPPSHFFGDKGAREWTRKSLVYKAPHTVK